MDYKLSVIMPIYNAEKYLNQTIESIIQQSIGFENIELILIDDNSTDDSKRIIENYANKFDNIIPYHSKENHGSPGFGRNIGIEKATAKYLMFIDNDDKYEKNTCEILFDTITAENADVVCCNTIFKDPISEVKDKSSYENHFKKEDKIIIENDDILNFSNIAIWNKIFKKEIIIKNNIKLLEDTKADDFAFCIEYFLKSKKLIFLEDYYGYCWNISLDSLNHTVTDTHIDRLLYTYTYVYNKLICEHKEKYINKVMKIHIVNLLLQCTYLNSNNKNIKENLVKIRDFEYKINFDLRLDELWERILNKSILKNHFNLSILIIKTIKFLRSNKLLRKLNRLI